MSATAASDTLDIREQIARIERSQEETRKYVAEQHKLMAEQQKLAAEAEKFQRERFLAPIIATAVLAGAVAGLIPTLLRAWGAH